MPLAKPIIVEVATQTGQTPMELPFLRKTAVLHPHPSLEKKLVRVLFPLGPDPVL